MYDHIFTIMIANKHNIKKANLCLRNLMIKQTLILFRFIRAYIEISIDTYVLILYHWRFDVDFTKLSNLISPQESNTLPFPFTSASESIFLHRGTFKSRCERTFKLRRGANFSLQRKRKTSVDVREITVEQFTSPKTYLK